MLFLPYIGNFTIYKMFVMLIISADLSEILNILGAKKPSGFFRQKNHIKFVDFNIEQNALTILINLFESDIIIMGLWKALFRSIF